MDSDSLPFPSDIPDEDLFNVNWGDVNLESLVGIDFDLDSEKTSSFLREIDSLPQSANESFQDISPSPESNSIFPSTEDDVKPSLIGELSFENLCTSTDLSTSNASNSTSKADQQVQFYSVSSTVEPFNSSTVSPQLMKNEATSTICMDDSISASFASSTKSSTSQPNSNNTTTFLQISPQNCSPQIIKQIVTSGSTPAPLSNINAPKAVIQHLVLPKTDCPTTAYLCKAPLTAISTPIQNVDSTNLITGIPLMVKTSNSIPVAQIVSSQSFNGALPVLKEKKSHNEIERRYRSSINDKITELRNLVAGEDPKLHKSQILKKAIDYIKFLLNQNSRLRTELNSYKNRIHSATCPNSSRQNRITSPPLPKNSLTAPSSEFFDVGCVSPPYSDTSSSSPQLSPFSDFSIQHHPQNLPSSPEFPKFADMNEEQCEVIEPVINESEPPQTVNRVTDRSRMVLCMMVFAVLTFNPMSLFFKSGKLSWDESEGRGGRTLMASQDDGFGINLWNSGLFIWFINLTVLFLFMVKFLVYGEPYIKRGSCAFKEFRRLIISADLEKDKGNYSGATEKYCTALVTVGRPLPNSFSEKFLSLLWQVWWRISIRLFVGKWLSRCVGGFFLDRKMREEIQEVIRDCVIVTNKLNKLHLMGHMEDSSHLLGLYLALSSLNWSDCSRFDDDHMADLLSTCALRSRESLPARWNILARLLLLRTRMACERITAMAPRRLQWLYSPKGRRFFVSHQWFYDANRCSLFSNFDQKADPLAYLLVLYREHLLERSVRTLVNPGQKAEDACEKDVNRNTVTSDVIEYLNLLDNTFSSHDDDEVTQWWSKVFRLTASLLLGQPEDQLYKSCIESVPQSLMTSVDPLPSAVVFALRARRDLGSLPNYAILRYCDQAGDAVGHSITISSCKDDNLLLQSVQVLVLDWILEIRTHLWEEETPRNCDSIGSTPSTTPIMLQGFQADLLSLRKLINIVPGVLQRVFLHEAAIRIMAGASPARTQQLLDRSLQYRYRTPSAICRKDKRNNNSDCGKREHAAALMMACRHLPTQLLSSPGERAGMLSEAAKTLEKIGDVKKMKECYSLMKNMSTAASQYC